jgi:outer membrane protein OmpA-like peptidoglycan-associated protein
MVANFSQTMRRPRTQDVNFWPSVADTILAALMAMLFVWFGQNLIFISKLPKERADRGVIASLRAEIEKMKKKISDQAKELASATERIKNLSELLAQGTARMKQLTELLAQATARAHTTGDVLAELDKANKEVAALRDRAARLDKDLAAANAELGKLRAENENLKKLYTIAIAEAKATNDQPPIIRLSESENFKFATGRADLSSEFQQNLRQKFEQEFLPALNKYKVDTIEIIGHTDGQVVRSAADASRKSNLDRTLGPVISGKTPVTELHHASNADLGLMRAVSVRLFVQQLLQQSRVKKDVQIRCYSAAQTVLPDGSPAVTPNDDKPNPERRRIEVRFTVLGNR